MSPVDTTCTWDNLLAVGTLPTGPTTTVPKSRAQATATDKTSDRRQARLRQQHMHAATDAHRPGASDHWTGRQTQLGHVLVSSTRTRRSARWHSPYLWAGSSQARGQAQALLHKEQPPFPPSPSTVCVCVCVCVCSRWADGGGSGRVSQGSNLLDGSSGDGRALAQRHKSSLALVQHRSSLARAGMRGGGVGGRQGWKVGLHLANHHDGMQEQQHCCADKVVAWSHLHWPTTPHVEHDHVQGVEEGELCTLVSATQNPHVYTRSAHTEHAPKSVTAAAAATQ